MARSFALALAILLALVTDATAATESEIAVSEVAPPPPSSGFDQATLKTAAEGEIKRIDGSRAKARGRRVLVSVALVRVDGAAVAFKANAILRDGKSGNMLAVVEGRARAEGTSVDDELK